VPAVVTKYQKRISGLLLDRIDFHIEVPRVDFDPLPSDLPTPPPAASTTKKNRWRNFKHGKAVFQRPSPPEI
jgi:predicted ATPase with chaperone activity